jgi:hypothetical protein
MGTRFFEAAENYAEASNLGPRFQQKITKYYSFTQAQHSLDDEEILSKLSPTWRYRLLKNLVLRSLGTQPEKAAQLLYFNAGMLRTLIETVQPVIYLPEDIIVAFEHINQLVFIVSGSVKIYYDIKVKGKESESVPGETKGNKEMTLESDERAEEDDKFGEDNQQQMSQSLSPSMKAIKHGRIDRQALIKQVLSMLKRQESGSSRYAILEEPGLLLTNRELGQVSKEILQAYTVCEGWVCTMADYESINELKPPIGGFFKSLEEMLAKDEALAAFRAYIKKDRPNSKNKLQLLLDIISFQRVPSNNEAGRIRSATSIVKRYLQDESKDYIKLEQALVKPILDNYTDAKQTTFDSLKRKLLEDVKADLSSFMEQTSFKEMVQTLHELGRKKAHESRK